MKKSFERECVRRAKTRLKSKGKKKGKMLALQEVSAREEELLVEMIGGKSEASNFQVNVLEVKASSANSKNGDALAILETDPRLFIIESWIKKRYFT